MDLSTTPFVVVDTETTGTVADEDRVIEIAGVKVVNGQEVERFSQLINPGRSIPRRITALTGISTALVYDAPPAEEVMPAFMAFLADAVFVAHNAPFDVRMVNSELLRLGRPVLDNPILCTLRLARRLLKGLRSKGLSSLADFYGLHIEARHRALGDAEATAYVLNKFLSQLQFEYEFETVEEVLTFQQSRYRKSKKEAKHLAHIRQSLLPKLPPRPGVYFMKDRQGNTIYIGKAKRLDNRVRSYFNAIEAHPERTRKLVHSVRDIEWQETGSELAALLLESKLIKSEQPRFNRALRRYRNRPFIKLSMQEVFPRVGWSSYVMNDGAAYYGPVGGRQQAEFLVDLISTYFGLRECDDTTFARGHRCLYYDMGRCSAPCEGDVDAIKAYAGEVERVQRFLTGRDDRLLAEVEAAMHAAAAEFKFEEARLHRDRLRRLEKLLDKQRMIATPVLEHHAALLLPDDRAGTQVFLIRYGRHVETVRCSSTPTREELRLLRESIHQHFYQPMPEPERYFKQEVEEIRILAHWMYVYRERVQQVLWTPASDEATFLADVLSQLQASTEPAPETAP
ncbi:MAG: DEDD exonuclease domain-containing protein [Rhodothermales bacterium]